MHVCMYLCMYSMYVCVCTTHSMYVCSGIYYYFGLYLFLLRFLQGTSSMKSFLKVSLTVMNQGSADFTPAQQDAGLVDCSTVSALYDFFIVTFDGGPYYKPAKCVNDKSLCSPLLPAGTNSTTTTTTTTTSGGTGLSMGATYTTVLYIQIADSIIASYTGTPLTVAIAPHFSDGLLGTIPVVDTVPSL